MTLPALDTLNLLLDRAIGDRDQAHTVLQRAEEAQRRQQLQAEQLAGYRSEYLARWSSAFNRPAAVEIVQCYRSFMERLDEALTQQQRQSAAADAAAQGARVVLVQCETRVASVRKLIERRQCEHQRVLDRRDQRQTDEAAQQAVWRATQSAELTSHS